MQYTYARLHNYIYSEEVTHFFLVPLLLHECSLNPKKALAVVCLTYGAHFEGPRIILLCMTIKSPAPPHVLRFTIRSAYSAQQNLFKKWLLRFSRFFAQLLD